MSPLDFSELIRDLGVLLDATAIDSISTTGAFVRGEKLGFIYNEDFDQGLHFYVDLGRLQQPDLNSEVFRFLLETNLELAAEQGEAFAIHDQSGHVLLRRFFRRNECSATLIAQSILDYLDLVHELRAGPLQALMPPRLVSDSVQQGQP